MACHVSCREARIIKGPWTREEDLKLIDCIRTHGEGSWPAVPRKAGLRRCSKSCRLRWRNYLRPGVKRGNFLEAEEETILKLHALVGNKWSLIARRLPGRTDNEIKNFWNTHMTKKLRRMGIDPRTHKIVGSAKADARSSIPFKPTGWTIPPAPAPIARPLEDTSASSRMQPTGYSVKNEVQICSEDRNNARSGDSNFFAGVPHENQIISELNQHRKGDAAAVDAQSHIQALVGDPTEEKINKYNHPAQQTDVDQWRQGDYSASSTLSEHRLTDPTEQISYYNSAHWNSSPSCYSSELRQNYAQKANTQTNVKSEFMGYSGMLLPDTLTEDSDSKEIVSMQEFCDQSLSPWSGLIPASFINNYLQSMEVLGDGGGPFGGFDQLLPW